MASLRFKFSCIVFGVERDLYHVRQRAWTSGLINRARMSGTSGGRQTDEVSGEITGKELC